VTTLALGTRLASSGGGRVTPIDPPILRRDLLQDDFFIRLEDNTSKIVLSLGTYDRITTEQGTDLLLTEDSSKFILTVY
jgi:hypothetical protein